MLKELIYNAVDVAVLYQGVPRRINGYRIRFPARYSRWYASTYEPGTADFLKRSICAGDDVLDVGAHFGVFSVMMSRLVGNQGHVCSFEPTPSTHRVLSQVVNLNRCQNVSVHRLAISGENGTAAFFDTGTIASNANSLIHQDRMRSSVNVETVTLDTICTQQCLAPRVLKIDVEGAELSVLRGGFDTLKKERPLIALSLHPPVFDNARQSLSEIWDLLDSCQMQLRLLEPYASGGATGQLLTRDDFCTMEQLFDVAVTPREQLVGI
jgi:FkbM family methyltransferase